MAKVSKRFLKNSRLRSLKQKSIQRDRPVEEKDYVVDLESYIKPEPREPKGMPGGRCNVTACQKPDSAVFLNVGMIGGRHPDTGGCYYCFSCATNIREANLKYEDIDKMTLFPAFEEMRARWKEIYKARDGRKVGDIANYADINQNPWGSCMHSARDKYLKELEDGSSNRED